MSFLSLNLLQNIIGFSRNEKNVALYIDTQKILSGTPRNGVSILDCKVTDDSQITTHPVESGAKISEHQIFNPIEIDMQIVLPEYSYESIIRELKKYYQ